MNTEIYAPHNAKQLSNEQLAAMEFFTLEELKELAAAFPDKATQDPYLVLRDKAKQKQTNPLSTWPVLYSIRKMGMNNFFAISFKSVFHKQPNLVKTAPVQDLTAQEARDGLKLSPKVTAVGVVSTPVLTAEPQTAVEINDDEFPDLTGEAKAMAESTDKIPAPATASIKAKRTPAKRKKK